MLLALQDASFFHANSFGLSLYYPVSYTHLKRPLHLKKSLDVITFKDTKIQVPSTQNLEFGTKTVFVETPYYHVEKYDIIEGEVLLDCQAPFLCVSILEGAGFLDSLPLVKGMSLLPVSYTHLDVYKRQPKYS